MRMRDVARFFDKESAHDGYTGDYLFKCQFSSFDNSASDGATNRRRSLSVSSSVVIPGRRCLLLGGQRWIVSDGTDDSFQDTILRVNYDMKRVTDSFNILTVAQACAAQTGTVAYAQRYYFKDTANARTDSETDTFWNIFFSTSENVPKGAFLRDALGTLCRIRQTHLATEGFYVAESDQLDADVLQTAVFDTGTFNSVTDSFAAGTSSVPVIQFEPSKFYRFRQQAESSILPGDRAVFVSAVTPKPGTRFVMLGKTWQCVRVQAEGDGYAVHARLA